MNLLPDVGEIRGVHTGGEARSLEQLLVHVQYTDPSNELHQVKMSFADAMYLLSLLRQTQRRYRFEMPDLPI